MTEEEFRIETRAEALRQMTRAQITAYAKETGITQEQAFREARGETWTRIKESTTAQEQAIRAYALTKGYIDLRSFRAYMRKSIWSYYDVIQAASP